MFKKEAGYVPIQDSSEPFQKIISEVMSEVPETV